MKQTWKKILCVVLAVLLVAGVVSVLAACNNKTVILVWGPDDHKEIYEEYLAKFAEEHKSELHGATFQYAGSGDSGAYDAMATDPKSGAGVYTFANDQMANMRNLGALAVVNGDNLKWSEENCVEAAVEATRFADGRSYAYPLQADNGYYMYYNKSAFRGTSVWDATKDNVDGTKGDLKDGYTFRDLYTALREQAGKTVTYTAEVKIFDHVDDKGKRVYKEETQKKEVSVDWSKGVVTWPLGDSWYGSGVFFAVGGDYYVEYDQQGKQTGAADCWFGYTNPNNATSIDDYNYQIGMNAVQCMKNSITDKATGKLSANYLYTDGSGSPLNDYITYYTDFNDEQHFATPMAACVCGTWKAKELQLAWGSDYAATVLPVLENDDGLKFTMKNFAGYKHMGVNPQCSFVTDAPQEEQADRLQLLHTLAQYLCGPEISVARYDSTGAGPANKQALANDKIAKDAALLALNAQYDRVCKYPGTAGDTYYELSYETGTMKLVVKHGGDPVGNGLGCRTQDSVPANYWTPIQNFGNTLYQEISGKSESATKNFDTVPHIYRYLRQLQADIQSAAQ